ncbi:hypothetical protein Q5X45_06840 [Acinetobacter baumannii]|nr:hypothetical protein [Acinetobacter baumannii]
MTESKKTYNIIREKLKTLNELDLTLSEEKFDRIWEKGATEFKININRLSEYLSFDTIGGLPSEALFILEKKLNNILLNIESLKKLILQKKEYNYKLKQSSNALQPTENNVTFISRNGKVLDEEELKLKKTNLEKILKEISKKIEDNFYKVNREAEEIYYTYCILLAQIESPIRIFVDNKLDDYFQPLYKQFKKDIDEIYNIQEKKILNLDKSYSSLFERFNTLDKSLTENVQDYQMLQENIASLNLNINKQLSEIKKQGEEKVTILVDKFRSILIQEDLDLKQASKKIKDSHMDFIQIVENAGIYKLTENYSKKAEEEKDEYKTYRKFTSWSIMAAILITTIILGIPIYEYWGANPPINTNFYTIMTRLTISVMFFVLALYLSKQAAKHYECYQDNHKTFLQLAALEPFISRMSEEDKLLIRKTLVPIYFNQDKESRYRIKEDEVDLSSNTTSVINRLIDVLGNQNSKKDLSDSEK